MASRRRRLDAHADGHRRGAARATAISIAPRLAAVMLGAVCHDLGKPATTAVDRRPHPIARTTRRPASSRRRGCSIASTSTRSTASTCARQVLGIVAHHLKPGAFYKARDTVGDGAFRRLAQKVDLELLARLARADCHGRTGAFDCSAMDWFIERARALGVEHAAAAADPAGAAPARRWACRPGPRIGEILKAVYELQLDGDGRDARRARSPPRSERQLTPEPAGHGG